MRIFALGGGSFEECLPLHLDFVAWAGKSNPRLWYVPTATQDDEERCLLGRRAFTELGCQVEVLRLTQGDDPEAMRSADLVYVGGGNTKWMIEVWRKTGTDQVLRELAESGVPMGGVSAGAICWFRAGNSDWPQYEGIPDVLTAPVEGLGWYDLELCPHARDEPFRLPDFRLQMGDRPGPGLALEDGCALWLWDDLYKIDSGNLSSKAYLFRSGEESVLEPQEGWRPFSQLGAL